MRLPKRLPAGARQTSALIDFPSPCEVKSPLDGAGWFGKGPAPMRSLKATVCPTRSVLLAVAMAWTALWGSGANGGIVFPEAEGPADKESPPTSQPPPERHIQATPPRGLPHWLELYTLSREDEDYEDTIKAGVPSLSQLHPELLHDSNRTKRRNWRPGIQFGGIPYDVDRGMMLDAMQQRGFMFMQFYGGRETVPPPSEWQIQTTPPPAPSR
jgi:hypothetical protein